jgi:hypothetical protein
MTFKELLLSGASLDEAYRLAMSGSLNDSRTFGQNDSRLGATMKPIDTCHCEHHKLERSHREVTKALRCLVDAITVTKALPITHINLVDAQHTLEQHGWQEKGE